MDQFRMKALEGLLDYLSGKQGGDLKDLLMAKDAPMEDSDPVGDKMELGLPDSDDQDMLGKPKGLSVEKVSVLGKPDMDSDMDPMQKPEDKDMGVSDDELDQLFSKFRK